MKDVSRRDFMKTVVIGGASLGLGSAVLHKPLVIEETGAMAPKDAYAPV